MKKSYSECLSECIDYLGYCLDDSTEVKKDLSCTNISLCRYAFKIRFEGKHDKVKLFPIDSDLCALTNIVVFSDIGHLDIVATNGIQIQNDYFFQNKSPYFVFDLRGNENWLEFQATVLVFDSNVFSEMFSTMLKALEKQSFLEKEREKYLSSNEKLTRTNQIKQNYIKELKHTIYQLNLERDQLKEDKNAILESEFWKLTKPLRKAVDFFKSVNHGKEKTLPKIKKIKNFAGISSLKQEKYEVILPKVLKSYDAQNKKKILLFTHELALTGAPVALLYFAEMLKDNDFLPVIISPSHGRLEEECKKYNIPIIVESSLYDDAFYLKYIHLFDGVVASTIVSAPIINALDGLEIPVLWWIHESEASYKETSFIDPMPQHIPLNVSVYTGGAYAYKMLKKYRPLYSAKELLYFVPEINKDFEAQYLLPEKQKGKIVFCIIGLQEQRKGQDILVDAIRELSPEELKQAYFVFVGKKCYPPIYQKIKEILQYVPENTLWIEELSREELVQLYEQIDCLVCASRDDPMPIVATETLQHGKMLICSENTGTASILEKEQYGFIYCNNSSIELAKQIKEVLVIGKKWTEGDKGKEIYKKYFSKEVFTKNALSALEETLHNKFSSLFYSKGISLSFENMLKHLEQEKMNVPFKIYNPAELLSYDENSQKNILLISHELSLTGAPIVLHTLGRSLKQMSYNVIVISPYDGALSEKFDEDNIPVIVYSNLYADIFLQQFVDCFDLIIASTVVTFRIINQLQYSNVPIIWWIHDSEASYSIGGFKDCMIKNLPENVYVYCGGEYAKEKLLKYYPSYEDKTELLYYCTPDVVEDYKNDTVYSLGFDKGERLLFSVIGQQDERKGHDVLVRAIKQLNDEQREKAVFLFVGKHLDERIKNEVDALCALYPETVYYIEQIEHRKLFSLYKQCDCIICSSKDDPLPVFVTEAMMMSKVIICSKNTGSAPILHRNDCGLLYSDDDPIQLKDQIVYVLENFVHLGGMAAAARSAYLELFTEEIFKENIAEIVNRHMRKEDSSVKYFGTVSVIIPTYNAGAQFETLILSLMNQKGIKNVELIVVDSGSSDDTIGLCQKYNVILKQISNKEFTHSYARNLGAMKAIGDVLVFMTQDALPIGENWIYNMILPIISGEAAATSGREKCPPETELYYKVSAMGYSTYLGTIMGDQLNCYKGDETIDELRRKASITDIASAISAPIFRKYLYRYNYAEDLDMGFRLLKAGYRIKLLSNVRVLHGHNRKAGYYIRRGFVEHRALEQILPNFLEETLSGRMAALKIVSACKAVHKAIIVMEHTRQGNCTVDEYFHELIVNMKACSNVDLLEQSECSFNDDFFEECIEICQQICIDEIQGDFEIINSLILYINNELIHYFKMNEIQFIDFDLAKEINSCVIKQLAFCAGAMLSRAQNDDERVDVLQSLMVGV